MNIVQRIVHSTDPIEVVLKIAWVIVAILWLITFFRILLCLCRIKRIKKKMQITINKIKSHDTPH